VQGELLAYKIIVVSWITCSLLCYKIMCNCSRKGKRLILILFKYVNTSLHHD